MELGHAAKANTNALMQVLFCVPVLRRLLRTNSELNIATSQNPEDLDATRNNTEMHKSQTMLLAWFVDSINNALEVLVRVHCPDSVCMMTTTYCALHKHQLRDDADLPRHGQLGHQQCHCAIRSISQTRLTQKMEISLLSLPQVILLPTSTKNVTNGRSALAFSLEEKPFTGTEKLFHLYSLLASLPCALILKAMKNPVTGLCDPGFILCAYGAGS
ncbi:hypothetical protein FN846DRAFT_896104 [Sphaerosporella brunnea]|uniref:Uncharacterized protein n=1 Tax=Sphaerosporella brunnea TaxID=1250544 RepID=A0A5J5EDE6_9PEZI|nr:hypothetical protein FN846DRAFT_896104 [Sphaerosporella brunnea]